MTTPTITDPTDANFATQTWTAEDKVNRDSQGTLVGDLPDSVMADRPTAELHNAYCSTLKAVSGLVRGTKAFVAIEVTGNITPTVSGTPSVGEAGKRFGVVYTNAVTAEANTLTLSEAGQTVNVLGTLNVATVAEAPTFRNTGGTTTVGESGQTVHVLGTARLDSNNHVELGSAAESSVYHDSTSGTLRIRRGGRYLYFSTAEFTASADNTVSLGRADTTYGTTYTRTVTAGANTLTVGTAAQAVALAGIPTLPTYTVATLPTAATFVRGMIWVSDETGGAVMAISDGTNWRRMQDYAVVS